MMLIDEMITMMLAIPSVMIIVLVTVVEEKEDIDEMVLVVSDVDGCGRGEGWDGGFAV